MATPLTSLNPDEPSDLPPSPPPLPRYPTVLREAMHENLPLTSGDDEIPPPTQSETLDEIAPVPRFPSLTDVGLGASSKNVGIGGGGRLESLKEVDSFREIEGVRDVETRSFGGGLGKVEGIGEDGGEDGGKVVKEMSGLQSMVCKMPDPVLVFYMELLVLFVLQMVMPSVLRSWLSRVFVPVVFMGTVGAALLWRRTRVIPLTKQNGDVGFGIGGRVVQMPNVKKIVTKGEKLRKREAALVEREDAVRKGQIRLEAMRKEIEGRLPPTQSVEGALQSAMKANNEKGETTNDQQS